MNWYTVKWFFDNVAIDWKVRKEFARRWNEESNHFFGISTDGTPRNRTDEEQKKINDLNEKARRLAKELRKIKK